MEHNLRHLRHARYSLYREVLEGRNGPCIKIGCREIAPSLGGCEGVKHELGIGLDGVHTTIGEEAVEIIIQSEDILFCNNCHFTAHRKISAQAVNTENFSGFVGLRYLAVRSYSSPVTQ